MQLINRFMQQLNKICIFWLIESNKTLWLVNIEIEHLRAVEYNVQQLFWLGTIKTEIH